MEKELSSLFCKRRKAQTMSAILLPLISLGVTPDPSGHTLEVEPLFENCS